MDEILKGLNKSQVEAVQTIKGPVLILAGAGSGKTKVLTHRVAYIIREEKIDPSGILAVTFTNKASREMTERIVALLGGNPHEKKGYGLSSNLPMMGTFHSICARILREDGFNIGFKRSFTIYDEADSKTATKQAIGELNLPDKKISPQAIKYFISSAKNELVTPAKYKTRATGYVQGIAADAYPIYQRILSQNNALDFDDLLFETVKLFQKCPEVLEKYQKRWQYIHVDEYQDTNHAQYMLVKLLAAKTHNLCVVGDDWQSIYSWRGADFQNILDFEKDYPECKIVKLEQNYRSTKLILDAAHRVISQNENRSDKELWTENETGLPIVVAQVYNEQEEARFVIQESGRLGREEEFKLSDMVVLYRTNAQSRALETELIRYSLPYRIVGGVRFYERKEIKDVLAYLKVINSDDDWVSFQRIVNLPPRGIGAVTLNKVVDYGKKEKLSISEVLEQADNLSLGAKAATSLKNLARVLEVLKRSKETESLHELIDLVIKKSGYSDFLKNGSDGDEERLENVKELLSVAEDYISIHGSSDLEGFLEEIALVADIDNWDPYEEALTLMTIHSAKGLEFKVVFLIGMEENLFPHSSSMFDPAELEEERRLCYVAITRARKRVYMTLAESRLFYGGIQKNPPSRFLADIPEHLISNYYKRTENEKTKEVPKEKIRGYFNIGDKVVHEDFGEGKVIDMDDDDLKVDFSGERKWLSLTYAKLKKKEG
jgi:DNA helicase-2/ATP-dependent DNA helicase PcrA